MANDYKKYLVDKFTPLVEALRVLNETGKRTVFVVDDDILIGALTYGDVSRWILRGNSLSSFAYEASTMNPISIKTNEITNTRDLFVDKEINAIPIVDESKRVVRILFKEKDIIQYEQVKAPVVIMAGGKGTRLYPYTKILPKPLIPIGEIPISEHIVNRFHMNGCEEFYFIVNYKKNMIKAYFNEIERSYDVHFVDEDKPLGTGGGLRLMRGKVSSTFILTNCDSIIEEDYSKIFKLHKEKENLVTMICSNQNYEVPYGVIETDDAGTLVSMHEKPSFSYLINTGTYVVEPEVIDMIEPNISIGFPDIIQRVKDAGKKVGIYIVNSRDWLDMGQFDTMDEMKKRLHIQD